MGEFVNDFTIKLPVISAVKSLHYGNFILTATVCSVLLRYLGELRDVGVIH